MGRFIVMSFILQSIGTILVFSLEYYINPSHPWLINGVVNEQMRLLTYQEATTTAFVQAAMFELLVVWNCRSEQRVQEQSLRDSRSNLDSRNHRNNLHTDNSATIPLDSFKPNGLGLRDWRSWLRIIGAARAHDEQETLEMELTTEKLNTRRTSKKAISTRLT
jgi:magnesium-transporting ATPase (P-type)